MRWLDAPEIVVSGDGAELEASTQAVLDELERVRRFGFTDDEVDRAVASCQADADADPCGSRLAPGQRPRRPVRRTCAPRRPRCPRPTTSTTWSPPSRPCDSGDRRVRASWSGSTTPPPQILIGVPDAEAADVPDESVFVDQAATVRDRDIDPPEADAAIDEVADGGARAGRGDLGGAARRGGRGRIRRAGAARVRQRRAGVAQHHTDRRRRDRVRGPEPGRARACSTTPTCPPPTPPRRCSPTAVSPRTTRQPRCVPVRQETSSST